ncbi:hypothetical protein SUGI_1174210 [Cryptomeria japonica]|nr:hypothetical protein SUGI_1174210 [Cryptomeria japonica]
MVESSCVIQVGYEVTVKEEDMPDVSSARIFRVPKLPRDSKRPFVQSTSCLNRPFSLWEEGAARYGEFQICGSSKDAKEDPRE